MVRIDRPTPPDKAAVEDPADRASAAVSAFLAVRDETTTEKIVEHLREVHNLDATPRWIHRQMLERNWRKSRQLYHAAHIWRRRRPDVIDLAEPADQAGSTITYQPFGGGPVQTFRGAHREGDR